MEKNKGGRPVKYDDKYIHMMNEYFNIEPYRVVTITKESKGGSVFDVDIEYPNDLPLLSKFAVKIGVCRDTLHHWANVKDKEGNLKYKEFSDTYKRAKECQDYILITNGLKGLYNNAFAWGTAKNLLGWRDKIESVNKNTNVNIEATQKTLDKIMGSLGNDEE